MPAGKAAKAASVGAKMVYGPSPLRVASRSAASMAWVRVLKEPCSSATSRTVPVLLDAMVASLLAASPLAAWGFSLPGWAE